MIYREIILTLSIIVLFWFISFKADQQFTALLKGKAHRKGGDLNLAHIFYKNNSGTRSALLFSASGFCASISIILTSTGGAFLFISTITALLFLGLGTFFKVVAFKAAERDLDEALDTARSALPRS